MDLHQLHTFRLPSGLLDQTIKPIQAAGNDGYEMLILWLGQCYEDHFKVNEVYIPRQETYKSETGCFYTIDSAEIAELSDKLYRTRQMVGAQVHSHPRGAFHSETDEAYPIATTEGSISIVLPFFGYNGWEANGIAVYRLRGHSWVDVSSSLHDLIRVV